MKVLLLSGGSSFLVHTWFSITLRRVTHQLTRVSQSSRQRFAQVNISERPKWVPERPKRATIIKIGPRSVQSELRSAQRAEQTRAKALSLLEASCSHGDYLLICRFLKEKRILSSRKRVSSVRAPKSQNHMARTSFLLNRKSRAQSSDLGGPKCALSRLLPHSNK